MKYNSLKIKLLFWFGSILLILLVIFSFLFYNILNSNINYKIKENLFNIAVNLKNNPKIIKNYPNYEVEIYKNNKLILKKGNNDLKKLSKTEFQTFEDGEYINAIYTLNIPNKNEKIIVYKKHIIDKIEHIVAIMFILETLLFIGLLILANLLINKILFQIKAITKAAKYISVNNFSSKIPLPKNNDELRELTFEFNQMIERLQDGIKRIEEFNSNVSHELRTPLTVLKGEITLALKKERDINYYQKTLLKSFEEIKKIENIINSLLLLVEFSKINIQKSFKKVNLDEILLQVIENYSNFTKKNIKINIKKLEPVEYLTNEKMVSIVFSNLLDNAVKYTPDNKNIYISLFKNKNIHFIIEDEGIGIEKDKINKITNRFYRIEKSQKGFGLGLSIVENIVNILDAKMKIDSILNKGTKIEIEFNSFA